MIDRELVIEFLLATAQDMKLDADTNLEPGRYRDSMNEASRWIMTLVNAAKK